MQHSLTAGIGTTIDNLREKEGDRLLDGVTALLKVEAGMVGKFVTDECVKLFGLVSPFRVTSTTDRYQWTRAHEDQAGSPK